LGELVSFMRAPCEKIVTTVSRKSYLATDELASYEPIGKEFSCRLLVKPRTLKQQVRAFLRLRQRVK
jgi:hypothetical protein